MTYFVSDDFDWYEHDTWSAAVEHALKLEHEGESREPVDIFEQTEWRCALLPNERLSDATTRASTREVTSGSATPEGRPSAAKSEQALGAVSVTTGAPK